MKKISIPLLIALGLVAATGFWHSTSQQQIDKPYFVEVADYEPHRNKYYYIYDINHPKMKKRDGTIKSRTEFLRELYYHLNRNCYFINYEKIDLVTPSALDYYTTINNLFRDKNGNHLKRSEIIKRFEKALIKRGDLQTTDTIGIEKDSIYYYGLREQYFDKQKKEAYTLKWGEIENQGVIPLENLKDNVINAIEITNKADEKLDIVQATIGIYEWTQICGRPSFEKEYAPIMRKGVLSQAAAKKILKLNQAGESIIIQNVIVKRNGKLFEINERFKFVVKKPQLVT